MSQRSMPTHARAAYSVLRLGLLILGAAAAACAATAPAATAPATQDTLRPGQQLFYGEVDLHGRIRTHLVDLPPQVVRCGNCHAVRDGPDVPRSLAPRLTRNLLLEPFARRGGPPSHYDFARFCALLRSGLDPAYVLISVDMPVYTIDDDGCRALWGFVTSSVNAERAQ